MYNYMCMALKTKTLIFKVKPGEKWTINCKCENRQEHSDGVIKMSFPSKP